MTVGAPASRGTKQRKVNFPSGRLVTFKIQDIESKESTDREYEEMCAESSIRSSKAKNNISIIGTLVTKNFYWNKHSSCWQG